MTQNNAQEQPKSATTPAQKKPNETGSISVEGFVKIFDPNTHEVHVEQRA